MDNQLSPDQSSKLTDWKNEPTVLQLSHDFETAKPGQQAQMLKVQRWNDLMQVRGTAAIPKVKGRSSVQPKLIRRQAEWRYSALTEPFLGSNKLFNVKPVTWEDADAARQNELVLNNQFKTKLNRVKLIDDFVRSTVDEGTSILRTGWCRYTIQVPKQVPEYTHYEIGDEQQAGQLQMALQLQQENPHAYADQVPANVQAAVDYFTETGQATYAVETGKKTVMVEKILQNHPTVDVINPQNFYVDPSCNGDLSKALFAIISFETNWATLKKEPKRYPPAQLEKVNWSTSTPLAEPDHATDTPDNSQLRDNLRKRVVAYEYWGSYDINGDGVLVPIVATWIGNTIIRLERNPFPDQKLPFVVVPYLPVKRSLYGEPDAELLEDNQKIHGAVMRGLIDLLGRSANAQRGMAKGMLDPLNRRRYENGDDYDFNPTQNPQGGIVEHKYPELPQSALMMLNLQNQEAESLTGVKSFGGGMSGDAYGDVAAGIRGVLDAASKREMAILRRLAQGMKEVADKITSMNAVFLSEKEVIRITNAPFVPISPAEKTGDQPAPANHNGGPAWTPEEKDQFVTVNREDLIGNFDLEVDIATAEVDDAKAKDLAFMLQTMGPNMDPSFTIMILAEIADLKRMPELAHKLRTFKPQPDPFKEQMQQIELAKAQAEVDKLKSEAALNEARAKESSSKADKTDLEYVQDQTGVNHAREMEKQEAQSQGNQDLAVTKALTTPHKTDHTKPDIETAIGFNQLTRAKDQAPVLPMAPQPQLT